MQNKSSFACWKCDKSWIECHFTLPYYPCTRFSWHSIFDGGGEREPNQKCHENANSFSSIANIGHVNVLLQKIGTMTHVHRHVLEQIFVT